MKIMPTASGEAVKKIWGKKEKKKTLIQLQDENVTKYDPVKSSVDETKTREEPNN